MKLIQGNIYNLTTVSAFYTNIDIDWTINNSIKIKETEHLIFLENMGIVKKQIFSSSYFNYLKFFAIERNMIVYVAFIKKYSTYNLSNFIRKI